MTIKNEKLINNNWGELIHKSVFDDMIDQSNQDNKTQDGKITNNTENININKQNITNNANNIVKNAKAIEALKQSDIDTNSKINNILERLIELEK